MIRGLKFLFKKIGALLKKKKLFGQIFFLTLFIRGTRRAPHLPSGLAGLGSARKLNK